jgi:hypothetical protein
MKVEQAQWIFKLKCKKENVQIGVVENNALVIMLFISV